MADNDLVPLDGGDIQPFSPSPPLQELQPLAPSPDTWGNNLTNPERDQYQYQPSVTLFGADLPLGTTKHQIDAILGDLARVFQSDFQTLGYPQKLISAATYFIRENATKKPHPVTQKHNFDLHGQDDWLGTAFANHLVGCPGTNREKQQFLTACIQWLAKANAKLNTQQVAVSQQPRTASNSTQAVLDSLSDAQYAQVVKANEAAKAATMGYLENLWGQSLQANLKMVDDYFKSLPLHEQRALDVMTTGYVAALSTKEVILGLYKQAIGGSLPTGAALTAEIEEHHRAMAGPNRKDWMNNERMGARYRELIRLRDGG